MGTNKSNTIDRSPDYNIHHIFELKKGGLDLKAMRLTGIERNDDSFGYLS